MIQKEKKDRLVRPSEVAEMLGVSVQTVHRYARENPKFPQKVKIGVRAVGFKLKELQQFIEGGV